MTFRDGLIAARGQIAFLIGLAVALGAAFAIERTEDAAESRAAAVRAVCAELQEDWPLGHPLPELCRASP